MQCPQCQQDNPSQARFCMRCGAGLTPSCSHCGTELPVGAAFCFACGRPVMAAAPIPAGRFASPESYTPKHLADKILTTRSALEGERKQVTVLLADVSGFELATRTNSRKYLVRAWRLKGEIALARRQWDEGEAALRQAMHIARAIASPTQLWKTHLAVGRLHSEAKRPDLARPAYQAARAVVEQVTAGFRSPELRFSFERTPLVQRLYDLGAPE
jgi:hypothetical protein